MYSNRCLILFIALFSLMMVVRAEQPSVVTDLSQAELQNLMTTQAEEIVIIDVRSAEEFARGRVPSAINIPHGAILNNPALLNEHRHKKLVFYCHSGRRAGLVTNSLANAKRDGIYHLQGDFRAWRGSFLAIEK